MIPSDDLKNIRIWDQIFPKEINGNVFEKK